MSSYKNIRLLAVFNFFTDFKLYAPLAIIYFTNVSHSYALGASIFSIVMVVSALFDVPTGIYSDKIGRKNTVLYGAICAVINTTLYALAHSYAILAIGAVFEGLSRSFYSGNNSALLYDTLAEHGKIDEYHHYSGKLSAMFQWALAIAGLLGGFVANISFVYVMWLSVLAQVIGLALCLFMVEPKTHTLSIDNPHKHFMESVKELVRIKKLRTLSLVNMIGWSTGEVTYQFQAAFYQMLWPLWAIGIAKFLSNVGGGLSFHFSGRLFEKYRPEAWLLGGNIYGRLANGVALLFPSVLSPLLMSSTSLLYGTTENAKTTLFQKMFTDKQRATMSSLNSFGGSLMFGVLAFVIGLFADKIGPRNAMLIIQAIMLITLYLYWRVFTLERKTNAKSPE